MKSNVELLLNKILKNEPNGAAVVYSGINRLYFSGFSSSEGVIFISKKGAYLLVDFRYFEAAKIKVKDLEVLLFNNLRESLKELVKGTGINKIFLEGNDVSFSKAMYFKGLFNDLNIESVIDGTLDKFINEMRMIKTPEEIKKIKESQRLTDEAFNYITKKIKVGMSEKDVAFDIEYFIRKNGAQRIAFDLIVLSGRKTSMPHGTPSDNKIQCGDFLTMDIGSVVDGYHSDMTRTIAIKSVDKEKESIYNIVLNAQNTAIKTVKPGVKCQNVDKSARDVIYNKGFKGCFGHSTGHSLGLEIHEMPSFSINDNTILSENMVMTIEPGIYIKDKFGVRIEDMIVVNKNGCENITKSPKELIII